MENENSKLEFVIDSSRLDKGSDENAEWPDLEKLEKDYILKVLAKTGGKLSGPQGAARILGIHYTTLNAKLKKYKIK